MQATVQVKLEFAIHYMEQVSYQLYTSFSFYVSVRTYIHYHFNLNLTPPLLFYISLINFLFLLSLSSSDSLLLSSIITSSLLESESLSLVSALHFLDFFFFLLCFLDRVDFTYFAFFAGFIKVSPSDTSMGDPDVSFLIFFFLCFVPSFSSSYFCLLLQNKCQCK